MTERRIYINEAAKRLDREIDTLRKWDKVLPDGLKPHRGPRRWRYWTEEQFSELEQWAAERVPGSALPGYHPDAERIAEHRANMRRPKRVREETTQ